MPNSFFTRTGDDGYSGLLGEGRVPKEDPRLEAVGAVLQAGFERLGRDGRVVSELAEDLAKEMRLP